MKFTSLKILALSLLITFSLSGKASANDYSSLSDTSSLSLFKVYSTFTNDTIKIRGDYDYYPYEFTNDKGEPDGLNVELIKAVMNKLALPYEIKLGVWSDALHQVRSGASDILLGAFYTKERTDSLDFSVPHNVVTLCFVTRKEDDIKSLQDLSGKSLAVQKDDIAHLFFSKLGITNRINLFPTFDEALADVVKGESDAVMTPTMIAHSSIDKKKYKGLVIHELSEPKFSYSFAVNKSHPDLVSMLNMGLMQIKLSGEYSELFNKWMSIYEERHVSKTMISILTLLVIVLILSAAFIITLRVRIRKAVDRLNHSERNFMEIFNATTEGIVLESMDGDITDCNQGALDMFGYKKNEFLKIDSSKILAPSKEMRLQQLDYLASHDFYTYERMAKKMDGTVFWVEITLKKAVIEGVDTIISVIRDISKRIKTQKELEETQKELLVAVDSGKLSAWTYDVKSDSLYYIHGDIPSSRKMSLEEVLTYVYPPDQASYRKLFHELISGERNSAEYILRVFMPSNPNLLSFDTSAIGVRNEDGEVVRVIGSQRDVTEELKIKKELMDFKFRMDFMMKSTGMLTWIFDVKNRTILSRDAMALIPNIPISVEEYYPNVHPDDLPKFQNFENSMLSHTDELLTIEYRFRHPQSRSSAWEVVEAMPFERDENNLPSSYIGLVRNNTKWRMMADHLIKLRQKAEEANVLKSAFLANMSHEIRTPLNAIVGFSQLITSATCDEERVEFSEKIKSNTDYLLGLVNDILDISKLESGSMKLFYSDFSIHDVCDEVYNTFSWKKSPGVELRLKLSDSDLIIHSDKLRLVQIITNYTTNALKFTKEGYVEIGNIITPEKYEIYVQDTGIGIAPDKQEHVFERFVQVNDFAQGSGLGLAISKNLADLMGGTVGVSSEVGKGSRFHVSFPVPK